MSHDEDGKPVPIAIDKVRASKAGHAYHEAWAARTALELLLPSTDLAAITLEGFDEEDEQNLGTGAVEIADLVRYHGGTHVGRSNRTTVVQFKYSIGSANTPVRAADVASTLTKFAITDAELRARHGSDHVAKVVRYEFATNRPIHENLGPAIAAVIADSRAKGDLGRQAAQITEALQNYPHPPAELLARLELVGSKGSLIDAERRVSATLAAWSEPSDPDAEKRLLKLRNLIRIKAGPGSDADKRIDRVAVLAELEVEHEDRLYPAPDSFPDVDALVERAALNEVAQVARQPGSPVLLHAAGGMGKTVIMQGLAERLSTDGPVILFDGFGAGRWRDPADGRHLPERTLVHLANLLAGQGLCDILLPIADPTGLLRAFRRRLEQSVASARNTKSDAHVSLVLDAIDHAGLAALDTGRPSFAHLLLHSVGVAPIDGVRVIASCRTERIGIATENASHRPFALEAFTSEEARALVRKRVSDVSADEIAALLVRSGRNPRCLDTLITEGRPFDPASLPGTAANPASLLDELLQKRLDDARSTARSRGASDADIDLLLTGIALLAPPVPIEELAAAHGLIAEQVESFAADLTPLLERTPHGLMFRDEPTETLIRNTYGANQQDRDRIIAALEERQDTSNYAARALPALLTSLRDADQLVRLAYDMRVPVGSSQVSARDVRLARITAAVALTGELGRHDDLVRLLLEASLVAAGHERSDRFVYEHPDLAAIANDPEALRRLTATSVGWPGGKHAALALANEFAGDRDEARRHARRSIDWHNWAAQSDRDNRFTDSNTSREWDDVGFAYVEMVAGNDVRVAEFFARRKDGASFTKFRALFDLFERQQCSAHPTQSRITSRLLRCQLPSRALYAAALPFFGNDPDSVRMLVEALSAAPAAATDGEDGLAMATALAAAQAIDVGLTKEAASILSTSSLKQKSVHAFSSYFPIDRTIDVSVIAAGVSAALRRRPAALMDLVPDEFSALVPERARSRGPAAFTQALNHKLAAPKVVSGVQRPRRKRRGALDETRSNWSRALTSRIAPLLRYSQAVSDIIRAPSETTRRVTLRAAFDRLVQDVDGASDYPYRDGKAYIARMGFRTIFYVADALRAIDTDLANRIADWTSGAPGLFVPELTDVVTRLSRSPGCHDAALRLAASVERKIQLDTDVGSRIAAYGQLARAVWRVSTEEAVAYFRRALDLAEAIGSEDFDRTNHLLELTGHYSGPELSPKAGHTLARILELNQNEDGKFPWIEYGRTMGPIAGLATLAMLARLDDRDVARFGLSLGPALTVLIRGSKLSAEAATALFGLAPPIEAWTWRISDFAAEAADLLPAERQEALFQLLLLEIDREDQLAPSSETIKNLRKLAEGRLPPTSPARIRIESLESRRRSEPELVAINSQTTSQEPKAVFPVDLTNPDEIDRQILNAEPDQFGRRWPVQTLMDLARQASSPAARLGFVRAVVETTTASLADKIRALDDFLEEWSKHSVAMGDALPNLGLRLASKHAAELAGSSSDAWGNWRGLEEYFHSDRVSLVEHVVAALRGNADCLAGNSWLALAARLGRDVSSEALGKGLQRYLASSDDLLPPEVGDGTWDVRFIVPNDEAGFVAGLIWAKLGHRDATMRWRAAHAVRRFAAIDRFDVIDRLIGRFSEGSAGPFGAAKLPFYFMHAQLWLLIAIARVSNDSAAKLAAHQGFLERVAMSDEFPHIVMRAFAANALRNIAETLAPQDRSELVGELATANQSPFPHAPRTDYTDFLYASRPETSPRSDDKFHLDYDFNKYHVARLCRVFGCPGWEVEDRINTWVRRWDPRVRAMYDCPRSSSYDETWSSGYIPERDRYGGYLGWHALMVVAGEMLATRQVVGEDWSGDAWNAFLKEYVLSRDDGLWLSDLTDEFPLELSKEADLPMPESGRRPTAREDADLLSPLLGIKDDKVVADWLPVSARWAIGHDTTLTIRSVLANSDDGRSIAMTLLSDELFFRWLPNDDDEIARQFGSDGHTVRAFAEEVHHADRNLDRYDPYASNTALERPFPTETVRKLMDLKSDDPGVRRWSSNEGPAFRAEAWGAEGGRGQHAWSDTGYRLLANTNLLLPFLRKTKSDLVVAMKVQKYHRGKSTGRAGDTSGFTHRSLVAIINGLGRAWTPRRLSHQAKQDLSKLDPHRRSDFYERFRAIARLPDERLARRSSQAPINAAAWEELISRLSSEDLEI
jgi:hypothetical protein